jgi:hypothetical protein
MAKSERTSPSVASRASQQLRDGRTNPGTKSVAGSALSQRASGKETSPSVASKASQKLDSPRTGPAGRSVAGSVLTQKPGKK